MFWEVYGEELYMDAQQQFTPQQRTGAAKLQYGNLSTAERKTNATAAKTWIVDLQVPWGALKKRIPMIACPNKIQVKVQLKTLAKCLNSDTVGTPTCSLTKATLRCSYTHLVQSVRSDLFNHVHSGEGVSIKVSPKEYHLRTPLLNTTGQQRLQLRNIKGAIYSLQIIMRSQADLDTAYINDPYDFVLPSRFWLEDNGSRVTNIIEVGAGLTSATGVPLYSLYKNNVHMHPAGVVGFPVSKISFCEEELVEQSRDHCFGSRTISKYNNPELVSTSIYLVALS